MLGIVGDPIHLHGRTWTFILLQTPEWGVHILDRERYVAAAQAGPETGCQLGLLGQDVVRALKAPLLGQRLLWEAARDHVLGVAGGEVARVLDPDGVLETLQPQLGGARRVAAPAHVVDCPVLYPHPAASGQVVLNPLAGQYASVGLQ